MELTDKKIVKQFDSLLFLYLLFIGVIGLVVLYSAGYDTDAIGEDGSVVLYSRAAFKQGLFWLVGLIVMLGTMFVPAKFFYRIAYPFYGFSLILLVLVLLFGTASHGATRWFNLGHVHFQPSELMKFAMILCMAKYVSQHLPSEGGYTLKQLVFPVMLVLIPMALIMKQPDLGTSLVVGAIGLGMLLFIGIRIKTALLLGSCAVLSLVPCWYLLLADYQKQRILTLLNPEADSLGRGYHIIQSIIAVGSGSVSGKGFLQGTQSQLEFLPEHTTDFIFSVLAEEWGFAGCIVVLALYFLLLYRMIRVARHSKDTFQAFVVVGIVALLSFHIMVNIGMVIGILPVVGIPLPFFSYGGSALLTNLFLVGIVFGVAIRRNQVAGNY